jgi:hypothetical protein
MDTSKEMRIFLSCIVLVVQYRFYNITVFLIIILIQLWKSKRQLVCSFFLVIFCRNRKNIACNNAD